MHIRRKLCLFVILCLAPFARGQTKPLTITGTQCVGIDTTGLGSVGMSITGTWSGTIQPEVAIGGDPAQNTQVTPSTSSTAQSTITANGVYTATLVAGTTLFQLCGNTVTNTATVKFQGTPIASGNGRGGGGGSFTAGGDLSGTNTSQQVVGIDTVPLCTGFTPTNGEVLEYTTASSPNPCYTAASGGGGAISNQVEGQTPTTTSSATALNFSSPSQVFVSAYCGSTTTCNPGGGITDESHAIRAMVTAYGCTTSNGASCNIIDDMTGTQFWTEEPLPSNFTGRLDIKANGTQHLIMVDGMSTVTLPTSTQLHGMGGSSTDLIGENTSIAMCNPLTDACPNGGFQIQNSSATTIGLSVSGSLMTVTLAAGAPFTAAGTTVNQLVAGRKICIAGATSASKDNGCFTIASVTSSTAPQVFVLNVDSTTQTTCASPCTAAVAYLNTPLISIGYGGGNGAYGTRFGDLILDCHLMIGGSGFVNGQGEEGTGTDGFVNIYNCPESGFELEQSGIYGGNGAIGTTNAGIYSNITVNYNPFPVTLVGGANCSNTSVGTCSAGGKVPVGSGITCGAGTANFGVLTPNPCVNPNWVGAQITGVAGNQGSGIIDRLTVSCQDKTATTACIFLPSGASQPTGIIGIGQHLSLGDAHTEFMENGADFCGDSAINSTFYSFYGSTITSGVNWNAGGLVAFAAGGIGIDIGTSGNGSNCNDINIMGVNVGAKTGTILQDNITAHTITGSATEQVVTYLLGHGTPPTVWSSSPTVSSQFNSLTIGSTSGSSTPTGVVNAAVGFQIAGAAASRSLMAGNGTDFVSTLAGVPVDATNPATLLSTDRANYLNWTSGTALALPAVAAPNFASNYAFVIKNTSTTLTVTPNAGASDLIDGAANGTIIPNFAAFVYQDSTTAPGHWFTIKYPTFAAFGSNCTSGLTWSTTTGIGCTAAATIPENFLTGAAAAGTITEGAATASITRAGIATANLTAPWVFQNTNSSNNNTSITLGVSSPGTSTGQSALNVNCATTQTGCIVGGTGGTWTAGVLSGQTQTFAITSSGGLSLGSSAPTCAAGTAGAICSNEGTTSTPAANVDLLYPDSTVHVWRWNGNNQTQTQQLPQTTVLHTSFTNSNTTFTTVSDGTRSWSWPVAASQDYVLDCTLTYQGATAVTNSPNIQITGPASPTAVSYTFEGTGNTTAPNFASANANAFSTSLDPFGSLVSDTATYTAHIYMGLANGTTAGTVAVQAKNTTGTDVMTIFLGSSCRFQ